MRKRWIVLGLVILLTLAGCQKDTAPKPDKTQLPKDEKVMMVNGYEVPMNEELLAITNSQCGDFQTESSSKEYSTSYGSYEISYKKGKDYYYLDIMVYEDGIIAHHGVKGAKCIGERVVIDAMEHSEDYKTYTNLLKAYAKYKEVVEPVKEASSGK